MMEFEQKPDTSDLTVPQLNEFKELKKIWILPFYSDGYKDGMPFEAKRKTLYDMLKERPKTAGTIELSKDDSILSIKHTDVVDILHTMETRRLRKKCFCSKKPDFYSDEFIHDCNTLLSLHDIYLCDKQNKTGHSGKRSVTPMNTGNESKIKSVNTYPCIVDYLSATESSKQKTRTFCNSKEMKGILPFSEVPKVGFVHKDQVEKVAERRKKCFSAPMRTQRVKQKISDEFCVRPLLKSEDLYMRNGTLHLEDVDGSLCGEPSLIVDLDNHFEPSAPADLSITEFPKHTDNSKFSQQVDSNHYQINNNEFTEHFYFNNERKDATKHQTNEIAPWGKKLVSSFSDNRENRDVLNPTNRDGLEMNRHPFSQSMKINSSICQEKLLQYHESNFENIDHNINKIVSSNVPTEDDVQSNMGCFPSDEREPFNSLAVKPKKSEEVLINSSLKQKLNEDPNFSEQANNVFHSSAMYPLVANNFISIPTGGVSSSEDGSVQNSTMNQTSITVDSRSVNNNKMLTALSTEHGSKPILYGNSIKEDTKFNSSSTSHNELQSGTRTIIDDVNYENRPSLKSQNLFPQQTLESHINLSSRYYTYNTSSRSSIPTHHLQTNSSTPKEQKLDYQLLQQQQQQQHSQQPYQQPQQYEQQYEQRQQQTLDNQQPQKQLQPKQNSNHTLPNTINIPSPRRRSAKSAGKSRAITSAYAVQSNVSSSARSTRKKKTPNKKKKKELIQNESVSCEDEQKMSELQQQELERARKEELEKEAIEKKLVHAHERKQKRAEEAEKRRLEVQRRREEKRLADLEQARKKAELEALAQAEKEKAESIKARLLQLEEEEKQRLIEEERLEREMKLREAEAERIAAEERKALEAVEMKKLELERVKRERLIAAAEHKLKMFEEEKKRQEEKERLEQALLKEKKEKLLKKERECKLERQKRLEEEKRKQEEEARRTAEEAQRRRTAAIERRNVNLEKRKSLNYAKYNQRTTKCPEFSYFLNIPRQVWELPIGWQKRPKYRAGGKRK